METNTTLLNEGLSYLANAEKINAASCKLSPEIIYNMVCLGLESAFTALLLNHNETVDHGSVSSLVRSLAKHYSVPDSWVGEGRFLNKFNTYCSLDIIAAKIPTHDELLRMLTFAKDVKGFIVEKV